MRKTTLLFVVLCALGVRPVLAQGEQSKSKSNSPAKAGQHVVVNANELHWMDAPPSLPPGGQFAVLAGNPGSAGVYTIRLKVPSGYKIPPHTHPTTENVTVISGAMSFGMGDKFDETAGKKVKAGGFASMPAGMKHFAWASGATVVQVHGEGPFKITYCHPEDDPRRANERQH